MKQTAKMNGKQIALGVLTALLVYLALLALASLLIARGTVGEAGADVCVWAFALLAASAGAKVSSWRAAEPLVPVALSAAAFWGMVLLCGFLASDGLDASRAIALALPILAGGALAYLLRGGSKKRGKRKRRSHK